jgi:hypothetical protein
MEPWRVWLPRALFESVLIVFSILLALALDQWKEDEEIEALVNRSVASFEREIRSNKSRIEDINAYHTGLQQLLVQQDDGRGLRSVTEFRDVMSALQSPPLLSSAWQTALATGVLSRMDYEMVAALSLTYSAQLRFDEAYQSNSRVLLAPANLDEDKLEITVFYAARFVADVARTESELVVFYEQTLAMIEAYEQAHGLLDDE